MCKTGAGGRELMEQEGEWPTVLPDVGRDALERHDGAGARLLGDASLLNVDDVHDDAALEHLGHASLDGEGSSGGRHL